MGERATGAWVIGAVLLLSGCCWAWDSCYPARDESCPTPYTPQKLPNGWPSGCADITGRMLSAAGNPPACDDYASHHGVGVAFSYATTDTPPAILPVAYLGVRELPEFDGRLLYADALAAREWIEGEDGVRRSLPSWGLPAVGEHVLRFPGGEVVVRVDAVPTSGCQLPVEVPVTRDLWAIDRQPPVTGSSLIEPPQSGWWSYSAWATDEGAISGWAMTLPKKFDEKWQLAEATVLPPGEIVEFVSVESSGDCYMRPEIETLEISVKDNEFAADSTDAVRVQVVKAGISAELVWIELPSLDIRTNCRLLR